MREQVLSALESLSDRALQRRWGTVEPGVNYFDDLTLNVNVLYDDSMVLPDPSTAVGEILHPDEVEPLKVLGGSLGELIDRLGEQPDDAYTSDLGWPEVVHAAARALSVMRSHE